MQLFIESNVRLLLLLLLLLKIKSKDNKDNKDNKTPHVTSLHKKQTHVYTGA